VELKHLIPAIDRIKNNQVFLDLRARTYLATYPTILRFAASKPIDSEGFHLLACMAYGWMPRIVRLEPAHINVAVKALESVRNAKEKDSKEAVVNHVADCLRSFVGASKVLHFVNPGIFPIWDSKVESFRLSTEPKPWQMDSRNYLSYVDAVTAIRREKGFPTFFRKFLNALRIRQEHHGIDAYDVSEVRAIELAAFELAGGAPEG
jgi:hypothetical protein